jgi:hypothetical protein
MRNGIRGLMIVGALLLAAAVGFGSYQAGVERGIEQSGKIVVSAPMAPAPGAYPVPYPYPYPYYGWHGPWHFGFFGPLVFLAFWFIVIRGLFWRRRAWHPGYAGYAGYGGCGPGGPRGPQGPWSRFDEWHRQAHGQPPGREGEAPTAGGGVSEG